MPEAKHLSVLPDGFQEDYDRFIKQMRYALKDETAALEEFEGLLFEGRFYLLELGLHQQLVKMRNALDLDMVEKMVMSIITRPSSSSLPADDVVPDLHMRLGKQVMNKLNAYKQFRDFVEPWTTFIYDSGGPQAVGMLARWNRFDTRV